MFSEEMIDSLFVYMQVTIHSVSFITYCIHRNIISVLYFSISNEVKYTSQLNPRLMWMHAVDAYTSHTTLCIHVCTIKQ